MQNITDKRILMTLMGLEIGGAETHVLELALELKRQGFYVVCASNGGVYEEVLKKEGITHYKVSLNTKKPSAVLSSLSKLKKIIKDEKIDIVHAHGRIPAFICGILSKTMSYKFTFVTTAHWVFETGHGLKYITNWGEKTVAVSEDIKKYLMDNYNTNPNDIFVTINGIDTNKFSKDADFSDLIEEFKLDPESKKIVYISRMDADRALVAFHLVEIAEKIDASIPNAEIVIVGNGDVFSDLKKNAEIKNASIGREMIKLAGARTDIYKFCAMSDLFIGVSRSALEAMACSKPVIVAGNEGYMGLFDEEKLPGGIETNFCCRGMGDSTPEKLYADITSTFASGKEEMDAKGEYGRNLILERYSVKKMADDNIKMYKASLEKNFYDALILGYYGYANSGDEALLDAVIKDLKGEMEDINIAVLSNNPKKTTEEHDIDAINRYSILSIIKAAKKAKILISGGGSLLQDVTSSKSLWYYLFIISLAKKCGAKVFVYANGIGPILKDKNRKLTKKVLSKVDYITLRDPRSVNEISELGIDERKVMLTADPALNLSPCEESALSQILDKYKIDKKERLCTVCVRDWEKMSVNLAERLAESISLFSKETGLLPVFVPMKFPEDLEFSKKIIDKMSEKAVLISDSLCFSEIMGVISASEILIGMRLHSLIYASGANVPTLAVSYDPKVDGFAEYIGLTDIIDVTDFSKESFTKLGTKILENSETIKAKMNDVVKELSVKAKENAKIAVNLIKN